MVIECTNKGIKKVMKYANLSGASAEKMIRRAAVNGTDIMDLSSKDRAYFESMVDIAKRKAVIYAGYCFIFSEEYCVNILKVPKKIGKKTNYIGKTQIRNPKKYAKHYDVENAWACA